MGSACLSSEVESIVFLVSLRYLKESSLGWGWGESRMSTSRCGLRFSRESSWRSSCREKSDLSVECGRFEEPSFDSSLLACLEAMPLAVKGSLEWCFRGGSCDIFQSASSSKSFRVSIAKVRGFGFLTRCSLPSQASGPAPASASAPGTRASSEGSFLMKMPACRVGFLLTRIALVRAVATSSLNSRIPTNSPRGARPWSWPEPSVAGESAVAG